MGLDVSFRFLLVYTLELNVVKDWGSIIIQSIGLSRTIDMDTTTDWDMKNFLR
jgi:hypothetical protein